MQIKFSLFIYNIHFVRSPLLRDWLYWGAITDGANDGKRSRARAKYEGHARASADINKDNKNIK